MTCALEVNHFWDLPMRLIIAEKPSVATAIADALGGGKKSNGFFDIPAQKTKVTWCVGHLLEQAPPESYVKGGKVLPGDLPILPEQFVLLTKARTKSQIEVIKRLLAQADEVVNAGDADREGQLLVDELFPFLGYKGKTSRLWLSSLDVQSVKIALVKIKPNADYTRLYESALARQRADWLVSLNASIALSRNLQAMGEQGAWSVGRVQTPTLALIVDRDTQITHFSKQNHYLLDLTLEMEGSSKIVARWQAPKEILSIDGLLLAQEQIGSIAQEVVGSNFQVSEFISKQGSRAAPMPYTLGTLQTASSSLLGLSAAQTLAAAQTLYESKLITYPRTDCAYLPMQMHAKAQEILGCLALLVDGVDSKRKHAAWNTEKVQAHHGILPTGISPQDKGLDQTAIKVFKLIEASFARIFMAPEIFETRHATFIGERDHSQICIANTRQVLDAGWTKGNRSKEVDGQGVGASIFAESGSKLVLPNLQKGQVLACKKAEVLSKETVPPEYYTDGTLISAMKSVYQLIADPVLKSRLKETSGLGTEATRAAILEALVDKGYVQRKGKKLTASAKGLQLIGWLRKNDETAIFAQVATTAQQEDALADIAMGRLTLDSFLNSVKQSAQALCKALLKTDFIDCSTIIFNLCPNCHGKRCVKRLSKLERPYHACLECQTRFADQDGVPGERFKDAQQRSDKKTKTTSSGFDGSGVAKKVKKVMESKGPLCSECKQSTGVFITKKDRPYFCCTSCRFAWWPHCSNGKILGSQWPVREEI